MSETATHTLRHLIGGEWVGATTPEESLNPSDTRDVVARVPGGGGAEVDAAVAAARAAFPAWSNASPEVRSDVLDRVGQILLDWREDLGRLLSREEGKTVPEGTGEVARAGRIFKNLAGEALRRHGQNLDSTRPGVEVQTYRQAVGVFGLITPWNFPIAIPALAMANSGPFGLSAGIVTTSLRHARDFQRRVLAGMVMVNLPTAGVDYHVPFGGTKASS